MTPSSYQLRGLQRWKAQHFLRKQHPTPGRCPNPTCKLQRAKLLELQATAVRQPAASSRSGADGKLRAQVAQLELQLRELQHHLGECNRKRASAAKVAAEAAAETAAVQAGAKRKLVAVQTAAAQQVHAEETAARQEKAVAAKAVADAAALRTQVATLQSGAAADSRAVAQAEKDLAGAHEDLAAAEARAVEREERSRVRGLETQLRDSEQACAQLREELRDLRAAGKADAREFERLKARSKELTSLNMSASRTGMQYQVRDTPLVFTIT